MATIDREDYITKEWSHEQLYLSHMDRIIFRTMRYGLNSLFFFLLDLLFVYILTDFFSVHYITSVVIGFITTTIGLFFANRTWTFDTYVHPLRGILYATAVAVGALAIITAVTYIGVEYLGLYYLLARVIAACFAFIWSYIADSFFTFRLPPFS